MPKIEQKMKNLIINEQRMTSLEIAEMTGKNHCDLLRSIRKMEDAWIKVNQSKFAFVDYVDKKGEVRPCYSLTKTECLYIATKFNDEARAKLILRWKELEEDRQQTQINTDGKFLNQKMSVAKFAMEETN